MRRILFSVGIFVLICLCGVLLLRYKSIFDGGGSVSEIVAAEFPPRVQPSASDSESAVDPESYYQVIIDNNIFRPLNWVPPRRVPDYKLLGTLVGIGCEVSKAYILEQKSDQFYTVGVGDQVGDVTVRSIASKRVTLTTKMGDELLLSLRGALFLNPRPVRAPDLIYNLTPEIVSIRGNKKQSAAKSPQGISSADTFEEGLEHLRKRSDALRAERTRMQERLKYLQER